MGSIGVVTADDKLIIQNNITDPLTHSLFMGGCHLLFTHRDIYYRIDYVKDNTINILYS